MKIKCPCGTEWEPKNYEYSITHSGMETTITWNCPQCGQAFYKLASEPIEIK